MQRNFASLEVFAAHLRGVRHNLPRAIQVEFSMLGEEAVKDARAKFGTYQEGWPQLAESTQAERVKRGFSPDDPLLRSGELRDLVASMVHWRGLFVGIPAGAVLGTAGRGADACVVMASQEWGTSDHRIPPRPVFGLVAAEGQKYANHLVHRALHRAGL